MNKRIRWVSYVALVVLYALHNDLWLWYDSRIVLGLPVGLTYHVFYNLAAAVLMFLLVRYAWPSHLEIVEVSKATDGSGPGTDDPGERDQPTQSGDAGAEAGAQR